MSENESNRINQQAALSSKDDLCQDCGHPEHDGGLTVGDCFCPSQVLVNRVWRICGCGYQTYDSTGRCTKHERKEYGGPYEWGCHKPAGHAGHCSTHWDCGHMVNGFVCGLAPSPAGGPCAEHAT